MQSRLRPFNLRPRSIQNMIGETINPRREDAADAGDAFMDGQALSVGKNQVESIVCGTHPMEAGQIVLGGAERLESVGDQPAAAPGIPSLLLQPPAISQ